MSMEKKCEAHGPEFRGHAACELEKTIERAAAVCAAAGYGSVVIAVERPGDHIAVHGNGLTPEGTLMLLWEAIVSPRAVLWLRPAWTPV